MEELHTPPERHAKLYFPDGDIVLAASLDTTPPRSQLFRVHKFLLRHHSPTFFNMFADADSAPSETYDGVPMVEMQDDKAEDLAQLLNYLYNPTEMTFKRFDPNTPIVVSGVDRLADKYCIESLRDHLIKQVVADWPTTLDEWDAFDAEILSIEDRPRRVPFQSGIYGPQPESMVSNCVPEPASAIAFAREFGCTQILPAAYYQLVRIPPNFRWENRSHRPFLHARWSQLDNGALWHYIHALRILSDYYPDTEELLSPECRNQDFKDMVKTPCYLLLERLVNRLWSFRSGHKGDPLKSLSECLDEGKSTSQRLCGDCQRSLPLQVAQLRQQLWDRLAGFFRLNS